MTSSPSERCRCLPGWAKPGTSWRLKRHVVVNLDVRQWDVAQHDMITPTPRMRTTKHNHTVHNGLKSSMKWTQIWSEHSLRSMIDVVFNFDKLLIKNQSIIVKHNWNVAGTNKQTNKATGVTDTWWSRGGHMVTCRSSNRRFWRIHTVAVDGLRSTPSLLCGSGWPRLDDVVHVLHQL